MFKLLFSTVRHRSNEILPGRIHWSVGGLMRSYSVLASEVNDSGRLNVGGSAHSLTMQVRLSHVTAPARGGTCH